MLLDVEITKDRDDGKPGVFFLINQGCPKITGWNTGEEYTQSRVMVNVLSQSGDIRFHVMANRSPAITVDHIELDKGWLYHTATRKGVGGCH